MTEVPEGFSNRQGVDIGIIGKYARHYLKTVFDRIYTVKGSTTAAFRKMWGLQEEYTRKERVNHVHHCIDAITIACIGRKEYDRWAQYAAEEEQYDYGESAKPRFEKPWPTFTEPWPTNCLWLTIRPTTWPSKPGTGCGCAAG